MRRLKTIGKWLLYLFAVCVGLLLLGFAYLIYVSKISDPEITDTTDVFPERTVHADSLYTLGNNWFRKNDAGLYEMYVEGSAFERGLAHGRLARELVQDQEVYFYEQINKMIPSHNYLRLLKYVIGWFNRNLDKNVIDEYRQEIYGVSRAASDSFDFVGSKYQRILNYHAAHDIGHALQNMALVGCTSFGTWGEASEDGSMILGRNFDFYVGDNFARNKIILFEKPDSGYKFMSVTWGGFIGVVSGMNEKGLTVTINAAKTGLPSGSATPVSLVAREILQYASTIQEAITIAERRTMFVAESFLVGSAADNKAVIIEKTPDALDVYDPQSDRILCANHFQSPGLQHSELNRAQMKESASPYRYQRLQQLMERNGKNSVEKTAAILRDRNGLDDRDIGMGNEKALNQFIAHHAVIFQPEKKLVWVSTAPWQLGMFEAYDLNKVFATEMTANTVVADTVHRIAADSFLLSPEYSRLETFRSYRRQMADGQAIEPDSLIASNPSFYHSYVLAGDYCMHKQQYDRALQYYDQALTREIATVPERMYIEQQIEIIKTRKP